jgi:hypothetical protein
MTALQTLPAHRIVRAIADAAARWTDADFPPRVRVLDAIAARTGYSIPVIEYALDTLFGSITAEAIVAVIDDELGGLARLDGFAARTGRPTAHARPVGRVAIVSSRTTIGVAIVPALFALCAKNDVTVKDREDALVASFFKTLEQEDATFGQAALAHAWKGDDASHGLDAYDAVVAFGSDATLVQIRERCAMGARFIGFGSKASAGYIAREDLVDEAAANVIAHAAARDLVLYETEGCLSLHALFLERGGSVTPGRFAELLAAAVERVGVEFPVGVRDAGSSARLGSHRAMAAFRAAAGQGACYSDDAGSYLLALDPPLDMPPFFSPRSLSIHAIDRPAGAGAYLARHGIRLEALAANGTREDIVNMAGDAGAARIARFGELQAPPLAASHGGRMRIGDFVAWITNET